MGGMMVGAAGGLAAEPDGPGAREGLPSLVPLPVSVEERSGAKFALGSDTDIRTEAGSAEARRVGEHLAEILRRSTGYPVPVSDASPTDTSGIQLLLADADPVVGEQGYQLDTSPDGVTIRAEHAAGLFSGVQTLRQLLPPEVESATVTDADWTVPGVSITDYPRFGHRSVMLDVARHFHPVDHVKHYIDQAARYKVNHLHLHLTDDQGWRIQIDSWPRLTTYGGSTQVGGGPGGYFTKDDYREIVEYAADRHITVVPEIDMPGHTNAALASYAELNCDGIAPPLRTDIEVGYSSLCVDLPLTYEFVADVIREVAELTPGPYIHIGGDEADATTDEDYALFMSRVIPIVEATGKQVMGWHEIANTDIPTDAVPQFWSTSTSHEGVRAAAERGAKVLMSPANKTYLDHKYDATTQLGLQWAGFVEVRDTYEWDPGIHVEGVSESSILGVESPLFTETIVTTDDMEYMAFPRLPSVAEVGWTRAEARDWDDFRLRLAGQAAHWEVLDLNFYRSPQIPWPDAEHPPGTCSAPAWSATEVYLAGDVVSHAGREWTAKWWTRGEQPGTTGEWGVWRDEGSC
ncbi:family 20 glycosylhydrolase [Actinoalloteichus spitiensis]|uniref:family 20 glycosylhydrolase n=1 Tax=Actinoalloteichus spitiensis TaxID=252394 RepID=UPI0009FC44B3